MVNALNQLLLQKHSLPVSLVLHLGPGVLIVAAYWFVGIALAEAVGYPTLFGFLVAALVILFPWELGLLLYLGWQETGRWSLKGVISFRNRLSRARLVAIVTGLCVWALIVAIGLSFIDAFLLNSLFSWVPESFQLGGFNPTDHSITLFNVATVVNLVVFGIAGPVIEELYFRGFLLPRMPDLGRGAPVLNSILFVLYHLWTPWMALTRILFVLPMVWLVWKHESIEVGIWTHCALNCIGILLTYGLLMSGA